MFEVRQAVISHDDLPWRNQQKMLQVASIFEARQQFCCHSDSCLQYPSTGDISTFPRSRCRLQGAQRSLRRTEAQVSEMQVQRVVLQKNASFLSVLIGFSFFEDSFRVVFGLLLLVGSEMCFFSFLLWWIYEFVDIL